MSPLIEALGALPLDVSPFRLVAEYVAYRSAMSAHELELERIHAKREILLQTLANEREVMLDYFGKRFAERWNALDQCFSLLNRAVSEKNDKAIEAALSGMLGIIGDNPLSDFEKFKLFRQTDGVLEI